MKEKPLRKEVGIRYSQDASSREGEEIRGVVGGDAPTP